MIQRIQSLFLLLAAVCYGLLFFVPIYTLSGADGNETVLMQVHQYFIHTESRDEKYLMILPLILAILLIAGNLITIFLFKNRNLQYKLTRFFMLAGSGLIVALLFEWDKINRSLGQIGDGQFKFWIIFLVLPLLLIYLANKAIIRDERMVRSAGRLR